MYLATPNTRDSREWTRAGSLHRMIYMKMAKPGERKSASKRRSAPATVDEYLATVSEPARSTLIEMRAAIRSAAPPEAIETISYRMPALRTKGGVLVWFAGFSNHCSLFPTAAVIDTFKDELKDFSKSKGTIHFPTGQPLPIMLIKKIVKARVRQVEKKKRR
jgi:uncharacterized protein YdhG (YjbR/CyaY superfamily)